MQAGWEMPSWHSPAPAVALLSPMRSNSGQWMQDAVSSVLFVLPSLMMMLEAKPFCLLKISKFGGCHAKILVEACVLLFEKPLKCLELLQSPQELLLTRCSGKWLSGPWCRSLSRLAQPVEGCWIFQPGLRLCSAPAAAKASVCWPRVHEDVVEGLRGTCSPLLRSQCWALVLDLTMSLPPA